MTPTAMQSYIQSAGSAWSAIVSIAYACGPAHLDREAELLARATNTTRATIKRKFEAVHHKREQGWTEEAITRAGQGATLSSFAASRKERKVEADTILRYRVPVSLGEAWEAQVSRLARLADLKTSEDLIEFLNSVFAGLSDLHIQNWAGTLDPNRKGKKV
jgi:hypothetical protein